MHTPAAAQAGGAVADPGAIRTAGTVTDPGAIGAIRTAGAVADPGAIRTTNTVSDPGAIRAAGTVTDPGAAQVGGTPGSAGPAPGAAGPAPTSRTPAGSGPVGTGSPAPGPAEPRRRRARVAATAVTGGLLALMMVATMLVVPVFQQYPARISAPDRLAGLERVDRADLQRQADILSADLRTGLRADRSVAAIYAPPDDMSRLVAVAGATGLLIDPAPRLDQALRTAAGADITVGAARHVPAGGLRGTVRCAAGALAGEGGDVPVALCAWADHGSVGVALFFNRTPDESADLFRYIRAGVLTRA